MSPSPGDERQARGGSGHQRLDARQFLAFHPFKESAARSRDEGEIARNSRMVECCDSITSTCDGRKLPFLGEGGGGLGERHGRLVEGRDLARPKRAVPDQRATILERVAQRLHGGGA